MGVPVPFTGPDCRRLAGFWFSYSSDISSQLLVECQGGMVGPAVLLADCAARSLTSRPAFETLRFFSKFSFFDFLIFLTGRFSPSEKRSGGS